MFSSDLLKALIKIDDAPWGDMNGLGRELTPRGLSQRLGTYGIKPKQIRIGLQTQKGYLREDIKDAWLRYLGVSGESDGTTKGQGINTENEINEEEVRDGVGDSPPTARQESETSETSETVRCPGDVVDAGWQYCGNTNCQAFQACALAS
jgi:Protein of unknown function (DUF3631)